MLHHPTTIGINYQPVVHSLTVRQACKVVSLDRECIRTGDRALVTFEFLFRPEYLLVGARLIFREGRTKGEDEDVDAVDDDGCQESGGSCTYITPMGPACRWMTKKVLLSRCNDKLVTCIIISAANHQFIL